MLVGAPTIHTVNMRLNFLKILSELVRTDFLGSNPIVTLDRFQHPIDCLEHLAHPVAWLAPCLKSIEGSLRVANKLYQQVRMQPVGQKNSQLLMNLFTALQCFRCFSGKSSKINPNSRKIKYLGTTVSTTSWPAPCQNFSLQKQCKGLELTVREATNGTRLQVINDFLRFFSEFKHAEFMTIVTTVYCACFTQCFSASTKNTLHPTCIKIFSPIGWIKAFRFRDVSQTFPKKPCNVDWTPEETEMRLQSFWIVITMGSSAWWY